MTIENEFLKVSAKTAGAELTSIYNKRTHIEHLWQADSQFWGWHAPVLFPVVGRCLNDEILIAGKAYRMEKHGFARKSEFTCASSTEDTLQFVLRSSESTLRLFPFQFAFYITYSLVKEKLMVEYKIVNEDEKEIFFQIGGHPAFAVPFSADEHYEDYFLEFEHNESIDRHLINDEGFFTGEKRNVLANSQTISLKNDLFKDDALIFKDHLSRVVSIRSSLHSNYLKVSFPDFPYLGFWAKENAPYVCIEPWIGCADTMGAPIPFKEREKTIGLPKDGTYLVSYSIEPG